MTNLTKQTFRIFWQHTRRFLPLLVVVFFLIATSIGLDVYTPFLYKQLFDALGQKDSLDSLRSIIYLILGVNIAGWVVLRIQMLLISYYQASVMADLSNTCFQYIHGHSINFFNNSFVGSLARKVQRFSRSFEVIADQMTWDVTQTILKVLVILVILWIRSWLLGAVLLVWALAFLAFNYFFATYKLRYDTARSEVDSRASAQLSDTISNNINLKLFSSSGFEYTNFKKITAENFRLRLLTWNLDTVSIAVQSFLIILLEFSILFIAVQKFTEGVFTIGDFALIQAYLLQVFNQLFNLGRNLRRVFEALAEAEEMTEILITPHEIKDMPAAKELKITRGEITLTNVEFGYEQKKVLSDFSLSVNSGERIALIGSSGGGKSTITKLLFRFFDIASGEIRIDGQDISKVTQDSLRNALGMVPQEPILFHRSILENIRYAKPAASDSEVHEAARLAHCQEFISHMPKGYDTLVGERGVKLSGGERQRVAIARAILKNAPILVLDEATSSLDSESERFIQESLKVLMKDKTTIVIAHRLSTIMEMDRIVVLQNGRITEQGTHQELLQAHKGTYQKLWEIQAGGFSTL